MNQRKLIKELGLKSTMKIRDYYGTVVAKDTPKLYNEIKAHCEVEYGDFIYLITFKAPKLKRHPKLFKGK